MCLSSCWRTVPQPSHDSDLKASLGKEGLSDTNREMLDQMQTEQQSLYQHIQELEARLEKAKTVSVVIRKGQSCLILLYTVHTTAGYFGA